MSIWEEVYSRHKKGGAVPVDPLADFEQLAEPSLPQQQTKYRIPESHQQPQTLGSDSLEEMYYQPDRAQAVKTPPVNPPPVANLPAQEREPQPVAPARPVKARFIPRIPGKLTIPYPPLLAKLHYGLSDTWANIMLETKQNVQTLLICGSVGKEGVTLISFHLAMLLSKEYSMKVLYVDTNLQHTAIPKIQNLPGVYSFVTGQKDLASFVVQTEYPGLYLLPSGAGKVAKNTGSNVLSREPIETLQQFCRDNFDVTIIDGQPVVSSPVMIEFARLVDLTLLVCRYGVSRYEVSKAAVDKLQKFGITSLGVILNDRKFCVPQKLYKLLG